MRHRLQLCALLCAWLLATGSQWDLVQTFAWGRMIAAYSHSMPLVQAVRLTFSGETMCEVCSLVAEARRQQNDGDTVANDRPAKILLFVQPAQTMRLGPAAAGTACRAADRPSRGRTREAPPTPPPRTTA